MLTKNPLAKGLDAPLENGLGGQSAVNGVERDNRREHFGWTASAGFPVTRSLGFKAAYFETEHWAKVGIASQTVSVGLVGSW